MEEFMIGMSGHKRRTKIVAKGQEPNPNEPKVLITRTLTVKQLVPISAYDPATLEGAREYEIDLPPEAQAEAVIQAVGIVDENQIEFTVHVDWADPNFKFGEPGQGKGWGPWGPEGRPGN